MAKKGIEKLDESDQTLKPKTSRINASVINALETMRVEIPIGYEELLVGAYIDSNTKETIYYYVPAEPVQDPKSVPRVR